MLGHWNRPEETAEALRGGWMHAATAAPWTSIATCVVIGVPDDTWGERVHAVVVPADGRTVTLEELREFCAERIAGYKSPR
jgi:acyl-CoA synthetase (AMP-forming)/AMP-acid ligase II